MEINGQVVKEIRRVRDNAVIFSGGVVLIYQLFILMTQSVIFM